MPAKTKKIDIEGFVTVTADVDEDGYDDLCDEVQALIDAKFPNVEVLVAVVPGDQDEEDEDADDEDEDESDDDDEPEDEDDDESDDDDEDDDEDDEPYTEPYTEAELKALGKTELLEVLDDLDVERPKKFVKASVIKSILDAQESDEDDDEPEDDDTDDDDESDDDYWTREELEPMKLRAIQNIAKDFDIETKGKSKADLIEEILAGDDEDEGN